jgi:hypothetical protein
MRFDYLTLSTLHHSVTVKNSLNYITFFSLMKTAWPHNTVHNITLYTGINIIHIYKGILSKDKKTG